MWFAVLLQSQAGEMVPPDKMASVVAFTIVKVGNTESASTLNPVICGVVAKLKSKLVIVPVLMKKAGEMKLHVVSAEQSEPVVVGFIVKVTEPGQSVDPVPPFTPRPGSGMPFASAAEDDSPRMHRISKQRKIFTNAPPHTKTDEKRRSSWQSNCQTSANSQKTKPLFAIVYPHRLVFEI